MLPKPRSSWPCSKALLRTRFPCLSRQVNCPVTILPSATSTFKARQSRRYSFRGGLQAFNKESEAPLASGSEVFLLHQPPVCPEK